MILIHGKILDDSYQSTILESLKDDCVKTLNKEQELTPNIVINACDKLAKRVKNGEFDDIVLPLLNSLDIPYERFTSYVHMFEKEALTYKCEMELGKDYLNLSNLNDSTARKIYPLGILFHIAAGNVDGLPAYSVVEGLLSGNINILKLPTGDSGLSIKLLSELIAIEPLIADYVYVFDVPSTEVETLKIFASIADGVVVWGGDVAVRAARDMSDVTTKVISWGHKLSFAYATKDCLDSDLEGLVRHICQTNQVLCSSCQGIYLDTEDKEEQLEFAKRFFEIFKRVAKEFKPVSYGMLAKNAINLYNEKLEKHYTNKTIFYEDGVSVIVSDDDKLELSYMFRNIWIKRLPRNKIVENLKYHKNHLQTVGLLCCKKDKEELTKKLAISGVIRITSGEDMSRMIPGESHDGTYSLKEYTRIVEFEI
jgi:hypothetical protein